MEWNSEFLQRNFDPYYKYNRFCPPAVQTRSCSDIRNRYQKLIVRFSSKLSHNPGLHIWEKRIHIRDKMYNARALYCLLSGTFLPYFCRFYLVPLSLSLFLCVCLGLCFIYLLCAKIANRFCVFSRQSIHTRSHHCHCVYTSLLFTYSTIHTVQRETTSVFGIWNRKWFK